ncbi:MAG TPA: hypothetical protein VFU11_11090 [Solirubrobacterales bacterium]|nr:hypothetical protein [Solirubrobacterales bacterium]
MTTLRLPADLAAEISIVARADGETTSSAIRAAVEKHIEDRGRDPDFQQNLKSLIEDDLRVARSLAERLGV